jgi:hypothetical protein
MRLMTWCASLMLGTVIACAQTDTTNHAPKLVCDAPEYDFGTRDNAETVEHTFLLRNAGDLTLEISNVRPACGCTVASISERSVPPGGESRVTARLSLAGRSGAQHKTMVVESNDPTQPQFTLLLKGTAGSAVDVQPTHLMYGQIDAGAQPTGVVTITGASTTFQVTGVTSSTEQITATLETVTEGQSYRLLVSPREPLQPGQLSGLLHVTHRPPAEAGRHRPAGGLRRHPARLVVAPRETRLGPRTSPGTRSAARILVRSGNGTRRSRLTAVEPPRPDVGVSIESLGGNGYRVTLTNLVANAELSGTIVKIRSDIAGAPEMDVPVRVLTPAAPGS